MSSQYSLSPSLLLTNLNPVQCGMRPAKNNFFSFPYSRWSYERVLAEGKIKWNLLGGTSRRAVFFNLFFFFCIKKPDSMKTHTHTHCPLPCLKKWDTSGTSSLLTDRKMKGMEKRKKGGVWVLNSIVKSRYQTRTTCLWSFTCKK